MPPPALTGPACPGTYASEFGAVAFSSWESMNPTLAPTSWGMHNDGACVWRGRLLGGRASLPSFFFLRLPHLLTPPHTRNTPHAAMSQRNYASDNFITAFSNAAWPQSFNATGAASFQRQLYWQTLGQALWVKSDIEGRRAQNAWGTITWQVR